MKRMPLAELVTGFDDVDNNHVQTPDFKDCLRRTHTNWQMNSHVSSVESSGDSDSLVLIQKLEQENCINERLIIQLRRMYEHERNRARALEEHTQILAIQLRDKEEEAEYLKYGIDQMELEQRAEGNRLEDKIRSLEKRLESIPQVMERLLLSCSSTEESLQMSESQLSSQRRTFRLKSFKDSLCNLREEESEYSLMNQA